MQLLPLYTNMVLNALEPRALLIEHEPPVNERKRSTFKHKAKSEVTVVRRRRIRE